MSCLLAASAAASLATGSLVIAQPLAGVPLIPREALFGNPGRSPAASRPTASGSALIAPRDGVMNMWVAPISDVSKAKPMTAEKVRPIRKYFWSPDSRQILYVNDNGGDENFLLYGVNVATGEERKLTPFEKTRVQVVGVSTLVKDSILVGLNNRDAKWHDVHSLDLESGKLTPVLMNNGGYAGFLADQNLVIRGAPKSRARRRQRLLPDRRQEGRRQADRDDRARRQRCDRTGRLHRRRQDAVLDRQPRPEDRGPDRAGRRDRQAHGHRPGPARRHRRRHRAIRAPAGRGLWGQISAQRVEAARRRGQGRPRLPRTAS